MNRTEFETAAREQNARRDREVIEARRDLAPCRIETMFAFGGMSYCTTHRVMGSPCPYDATVREPAACTCPAPCHAWDHRD